MQADLDGSKEKRVKAGAPKWSTAAFKEFINYQERLMEVLDLSSRGIDIVTSAPKMVKALAKAEGTTTTIEYKNQLAKAESMAKLAVFERDNDFPILHAQFVVSLWGSLETLVLDVVADWIVNQPEVLNTAAWHNIRVKVSEYETLDTEQKAIYLASSMDQMLSGPLKGGVNRFESLMETVGLKGAVSSEVSKTLWELQQVRNIIAHKRGIADKKFCGACPWLGSNPGDIVSVGRSMYNKYFEAVIGYSTELIARTGEYFGVSDMRARNAERLDQPNPEET
jgi:hypothetical protein